ILIFFVRFLTLERNLLNLIFLNFDGKLKIDHFAMMSMKRKKQLAAFLLSLVLLLGLPMANRGSDTYAQSQISFSFFHNTLSSYGSWVNTGNYGSCWRPSGIASNWQPYYTDGHWVYTDYGWTWVSDDP